MMSYHKSLSSLDQLQFLNLSMKVLVRLTGPAVPLDKALKPPSTSCNSPVRATKANDVRKKIYPLKVTVIRYSLLEGLRKLKNYLKMGSSQKPSSRGRETIHPHHFKRH